MRDERERGGGEGGGRRERGGVRGGHTLPQHMMIPSQAVQEVIKPISHAHTP